MNILTKCKLIVKERQKSCHSTFKNPKQITSHNQSCKLFLHTVKSVKKNLILSEVNIRIESSAGDLTAVGVGG